MKPQKVLYLHLEEAKKVPKIQDNYIVTEKLDGWYVYIEFRKVKGWCKPKSSNGREIPSMCFTLDWFNKLPRPKENCILIMEAIIPDTNFHTANGIFNRTLDDCRAVDVVFNVHDIIFPDFELTAIQRFNILTEIDLSSSNGKLRLTPILTISNDKRLWLHYFDQVIENSGEGIILKAENSLYYPGKRNSTLMKIKMETTVDLLCSEIFYTTGEKGNSNLNIIVKRKSGALITIRIPKYEDIKLIEEDSSNIIGKVVEIKAMQELENGMLREPRFIRIRNDKNINEID